MLQDSVNEKRREPKTETRKCLHEKDKEESKKETEEGEARDVGGNTEESVFTGSKGSKSLKNLANHTRGSIMSNSSQVTWEKLKKFIKKRISELNESSLSRMV